jgi:hypothetical protein
VQRTGTLPASAVTVTRCAPELAETSQPEERADVPITEWLPDTEEQRYEVNLRNLLGAVEAMEDGSRPGEPCPGEPRPGEPGPGTGSAAIGNA